MLPLDKLVGPGFFFVPRKAQASSFNGILIVDPATALIALSVLFYTSELSNFFINFAIVRISRIFLIWWYSAFRALGVSSSKKHFGI